MSFYLPFLFFYQLVDVLAPMYTQRCTCLYTGVMSLMDISPIYPESIQDYLFIYLFIIIIIIIICVVDNKNEVCALL